MTKKRVKAIRYVPPPSLSRFHDLGVYLRLPKERIKPKVGVAGDVSVIDTASNTVTTTAPVGSGPFGVVITPDGTRAYVTNALDNTVSVINTTSNIVTATVQVGGLPLGVAITP